jgi:hypothetical protein
MLFKRSDKKIAKNKANIVLLANKDKELFAIDLRSKALIRISIPECSFYIKPMTLATALNLEPLKEINDFFPDAYEAKDVIFYNYKLPNGKAKKLIAQYLAPQNNPLFGLRGQSIKFNTMSGNYPTIAIVEPNKGPFILSTSPIYLRFSLGVTTEVLMLANEYLTNLFNSQKIKQWNLKVLSLKLGFKPKRLLVILDRPFEGYCTKIVVGFLP